MKREHADLLKGLAMAYVTLKRATKQNRKLHAAN